MNLGLRHYAGDQYNSLRYNSLPGLYASSITLFWLLVYIEEKQRIVSILSHFPRPSIL